MNETKLEQIPSLEDAEERLRADISQKVSEIEERLAEIKKILAEKVHWRREAA